MSKAGQTALRKRYGLLAAALCVCFGLGLLLGQLTANRSRQSVTVQTSAGGAAALPAPEETAALLLDLNTATAEELTSLDGIGEQLAARIVAYREENGPFRYVYEPMNVSGIGEKKYEAIRDSITVRKDEMKS